MDQESQGFTPTASRSRLIYEFEKEHGELVEEEKAKSWTYATGSPLRKAATTSTASSNFSSPKSAATTPLRNNNNNTPKASPQHKSSGSPLQPTTPKFGSGSSSSVLNKSSGSPLRNAALNRRLSSSSPRDPSKSAQSPSLANKSTAPKSGASSPALNRTSNSSPKSSSNSNYMPKSTASPSASANNSPYRRPTASSSALNTAASSMKAPVRSSPPKTSTTSNCSPKNVVNSSNNKKSPRRSSSHFRASPAKGCASPSISDNGPAVSVMKRAAIFDTPRPAAKDPTELSLTERKALFERNKGQAPTPKMSTPASNYSRPHPATATTAKAAATTTPAASASAHSTPSHAQKFGLQKQLMEQSLSG